METLINGLKNHFEWKHETQKFNSIKSIEKSIETTFRKLEKEFESYSLNGKKIVSIIKNEDSSKLGLSVNTMFSEGDQKRELVFELQPFSDNPLYLISCKLPDSEFEENILKIGDLEVQYNKSIIKFSEGASSFGLYDSEVFSQETLEDLVETVILYGL